MTRYSVSLNDGNEKNTLELVDENSVYVNGKLYSHEHRFLSDNALILRINNKNYFMTLAQNEEENIFEIDIDSQNFKVVCKSDLDLLVESMSTSKGNSKIKKEIKSPMPGIIKFLNVKSGQIVKKGDVLLVLEAMKMENEIKALIDGVIKKVNVEALNSVEKNELLMIYE